MSLLNASLWISPSDALIDVKRRIAVTGLLPDEEVTLRTRTVRGPGIVWRSAAVFRASADGRVDLEHDAPIATDPPGGAYTGV